MRSAAVNTQYRAIVRDNEQLGRRPRSPRSADVKNHYVSRDGGLGGTKRRQKGNARDTGFCAFVVCSGVQWKLIVT